MVKECPPDFELHSWAKKWRKYVKKTKHFVL